MTPSIDPKGSTTEEDLTLTGEISNLELDQFMGETHCQEMGHL